MFLCFVEGHAGCGRCFHFTVYNEWVEVSIQMMKQKWFKRHG